MKKLLYVLLAVLLVMSLAACGPKQSNVQPDNAQQDNAQMDNTQTDDAQPAAKTFARGSWDASGKTFTSDYSGITIKISDDYTALTDAELAENYLDDSAFDLAGADYEKMTNIPDCAFINYMTGSNTDLLYENVTAEGAPDISEDDYLDAAKGGLDGVIGGYYDVTIGGKQFRAMNRSVEQGDHLLYQTMAVRNIDGYMLIVAFTSFDKDSVDEMISFFE